MKRASILFLILLVLPIMALTAGCTEQETYDVVCTIFPQYDFCREIAGDELRIKMLLPAGTDAHNYQLTISDKMAIKNSKLFVYVGGESEKWVNDIIKSTDLSKTECLKLTSLVELIRLTEDAHDHDHDHEHVNEYDEHVYLSIQNAAIFCDDICGKLCDLFPGKEELFRENTEKYISKLNFLDSQYQEKLSSLSTRTIFFADRYPFAYLAKEYDLQCVTPYHGCSTDMELTLKEKTDFKNAYLNSNARGVFVLENGYDDLAQNVTSANNGKIFRMHSCQSLSIEELEEKKSYLSIMSENLHVLTEALA